MTNSTAVPWLALPWLALSLLVAACASTSGQAATTAAPAELGEPALMEKLRGDVKPAPASALALADQGERRFANSPHAEERRALAIQALINLGQIGEARSRAYQFLERYPRGPYSDHVAAMTGVHPTPVGSGQPD
jgi:outer membrane protein assembly factor BamD (BamD/ComL family)